MQEIKQSYQFFKAKHITCVRTNTCATDDQAITRAFVLLLLKTGNMNLGVIIKIITLSVFIAVI